MEIIEIVEQSKPFKEWRAAHDTAYLVHVFAMQKAEGTQKHVGYYDPQTTEITTFTDTPQVTLTGSDKSFKEDDAPITKLDMSTVKIDLDQALETAAKIMLEKYSAHVVTQKICILQHLDTQLWNLTLITSSFNMVNIRIDAASGEVLSDQIRSIMDLGTQE